MKQKASIHGSVSSYNWAGKGNKLAIIITVLISGIRQTTHRYWNLFQASSVPNDAGSYVA
jgi:hypothetical protein